MAIKITNVSFESGFANFGSAKTAKEGIKKAKKFSKEYKGLFTVYSGKKKVFEIKGK